MGDYADLVIAFNEQVLYGRLEQKAYGPGTVLLIDQKWRHDPVPEVREKYTAAIEQFKAAGLDVRELPIEEACLKLIVNITETFAQIKTAVTKSADSSIRLT